MQRTVSRRAPDERGSVPHLPWRTVLLTLLLLGELVAILVMLLSVVR